MGRFLRLVVYLLILLGAAGGGVALWGHGQLVRPGPLAAETTVVIPRGVGVSGVVQVLAREGVITDARIFRIGARLTGADKGLRAGEFVFPAGVSPRGVMDILRHGKTVVRRLTAAEGLTSVEVVALLRSVEGLSGTVDAVPAEGSLLPETYHFSHGDDRTAVIGRMTAAMDETLAGLWAARAPGLPLKTPEEAVILASIVEKETGVAAERARVAGVFVNRLRKGMRLQSDPAVAYGVTLGKAPLGRPLSRKDLQTPTPYNTYTIPALPPGPICNPGRAALEAVLNPADTDALYFVADGTGGHVFARTLTEHNRNVARWRKIQKGKK